MPRKPRSISSTGIYHITLRSINQHIIFEEDSDYQKFLFILSDCKAIFDIDIYAYCLMDNHVHLLLHASPKNMSSFFQSLGSRFVRWYNCKYSRSGHLFQDRYFSVPVEDDNQYLSTLIYIHNNPVKALVCRFPSEYPWSSYNVFYGRQNHLVNVTYSYNIVGSKELLQKYFSNHEDSDACYPDIHVQSRHFIPDDKALRIFKSVTALSSTSEAVKLSKPARNSYTRTLRQKGLTVKQISRLMGISVSTVKKICKNEPQTPSPKATLLAAHSSPSLQDC